MADADAGVVDQDIYRSHTIDSLSKCGLDIVRFRYIGLYCAGEVRQFLPYPGQRIRIAIKNADIGSFFEKTGDKSAGQGSLTKHVERVNLYAAGIDASPFLLAPRRSIFGFGRKIVYRNVPCRLKLVRRFIRNMTLRVWPVNQVIQTSIIVWRSDEE